MPRPKSENRKDVNIKVRFDQLSNDQLKAYCESHGLTRTQVLRKGAKLIISLSEGVKDEDLQEYEESLDACKKRLENLYELINNNESKSSLEEQLNEIYSALKDKLFELYGILENTRDKYLKEEGLDPKQIKEQADSITMPCNVRIFELQKDYYDLIQEIFDYKEKIWCPKSLE